MGSLENLALTAALAMSISAITYLPGCAAIKKTYSQIVAEECSRENGGGNAEGNYRNCLKRNNHPAYR